MKHLLILLPFIVTMSFTQPPSFSVEITSGGDAKVIVAISNPAKEKLNLVVRHTLFGRVADTTITSQKIRCLFNIEQLDDGKYELELSNGKEQIVQTFTMTTRQERKISVNRKGF